MVISLCIIFVLVIFAYLIYKNNDLNSQISRLNADLINRDTLIDVQNAKIAQDKIDLEAFIKEREESQKHVQEKYGKIILDDTTASTECLYCGNTAIIKERLTGEFRPDFIVPFRTTKEHIYEQFKVLEKNNTQIDKNFIQNMKIKKIKPVYIPYFLYSFNLSARCTLAYQNQNNGQFFFKEKKARIILKDVPMDGSVELDDDTMATLFPYNLEDKLEYNDAYLSGWHAEMYDEPKEKITNVLIERAKTVMRR